jgi:NADH:ubiquinone oxidoreductase subunit F (NADH-binding)
VSPVTTGPHRLLAGPDFGEGAEGYAAHVRRLGELPIELSGSRVIDEVERSGLLGRGGAGFSVGRKWRAVAARARRGAVVIANGAEGEPRSAKDRAIMTLRPHLVIDGAVLAALSVGADWVRIYVGTEHAAAADALSRALAERPNHLGVDFDLVEAPTGYVSGESSAVVRYLNERDARPMSKPPHPFELGIAGRPTLVQNVESLAYAALIARHGAEWYRQPGRGQTRGTALVTVSGPVTSPGVREIEYGTTLRELLAVAGGETADIGAVLVGGYFGGWASIDSVLDLPLDPATLGDIGLGFGCGLIGLLPADACGVWATEQIVAYMAGESARQCGPCLFGLGAMAASLRRLGVGEAHRHDLRNLARWADEIEGRGACHHPDGTAALMRSGLAVFADEFALHADGRCSRPVAAARGLAS